MKPGPGVGQIISLKIGTCPGNYSLYSVTHTQCKHYTGTTIVQTRIDVHAVYLDYHHVSHDDITQVEVQRPPNLPGRQSVCRPTPVAVTPCAATGVDQLDRALHATPLSLNISHIFSS